MVTNVTIFSSGSLNAVTHIWEDTMLHGFRGSVAVAVTDQNTTPLWVSPTQIYGVDGTLTGTSDRTLNWSSVAPAEILPNIRKVAIIQKWDPKNAFDDIEAWLSGLADAANQLAIIAKDVTTIIAAV
jgi:hypothetical protein